MLSMNRLGDTKRIRVVRCLVEGNSIRATVRMTGVAKNTVVKLLVDLGTACAQFQDAHLRNLPCRRVQCEEIWSFAGAKQKNVPADEAEQWGDVGTWTAIDADTKIAPCWMVGQRGVETAMEFIGDLANRLSRRVQLTTDGHRPYLTAAENAFGGEIDFAQLLKIYGTPISEAPSRHNPGQCVGTMMNAVSGNPDPKHIRISSVERANLTIRMSMRRFTRLTNAFSKKLENHMAAIALHFMYYNFARIHQSLRITPAMAAGVADRVWDVEDIVALLDNSN